MRINPVPLIAALLLFSFQAFSQKDSSYPLLLKSGSILPQKNISTDLIKQFDQKALRIDGYAFALIQFDHIPTAAEQRQLSQSGIELLHYIPKNAYAVSIKGAVNSTMLQSVNARSLVELTAQQKMPAFLANGIIPSWAVKTLGTADVWISFPGILSFESVSRELRARNFDIVSALYKDYHIIGLRVPSQRINELASLSFIEYVQPAPHEDQPLNNVTRSNARANLLNGSVAVGGRNLKGEGIVVGVGDNANPSLHVDFTNRLINRTYASAAGEHGKHVAGTVGGAGIMNELYKGYAPRATIIAQYFSGIWQNAGAYVQDYGMVLTNNSYGAVAGDCSYNGLYDMYSQILDQQAFDYPYLQHVFAGGNSGGMTCSPYPPGFKTVLGSYQSAKNVISVGATDSAGSIRGFSSKGPVRDGRLKPEISAMGEQIVSAGFGSYWYNTGTSMACPGITGGLALLYQLYKEKNGGSNPKNGLMKAIACNTSRDMGNTGPDFSYGFGWMDLQRAALTIENNRYFTSTIANSIENTHSISVPANAAQLKVMLYWNDPPASLLTAQTLVNDLDLTVQTPSATTILPKILDTVPSNVTAISTEGADHINNIEQVVINNPSSGSYSIKVNGTSITQNSPQEYFIVYDIVPDSTKLTFPIGEETFSTVDSALILWDANGTAATFTLKYSTDDGANWTTINNSVSGSLRQYKWYVPNVPTDKTKIQLTNNTTGFVSTSNTFTISGVPVVSLADTLCEGYIKIKWPVIPNATDYEVFMLRGSDMQSMAITTDTFYVFSGLSKDSVYWVATRARINGTPGRRSVAISRQPNTGTCLGSISDNDLKADAVVAPVSGRKFTTSELGAAVQIKLRVKNLDNVATSNFDIKYSVNGGGWVTQTIPGPLNAGDTVTYTFAATYDFSAVGTYTLKAVVYNAPDPVRTNDTLTVVIKQLANAPINLTTAFTENFDAASQQEFNTPQTGLTDLDRFDFSNSSSYGRLRSFINTGIAHSGNRAISLDVSQYIHPADNTNYLTGTFNLSNYDANTNDIRLDFYYNNHGQRAGAENQVWIRKADSTSWIPVYDLYANQNDEGIYKHTPSIEIAHLLANASQNFTTGFQVRWGQYGYFPAVDKEHAGGYSFDDIRIYEVFNDMQMLSIDTPIVSSCGLSANVPVKITVRNSSNAVLNSVPVKYRVDGNSWITETISSIAATTTIQFTFATLADLSVTGTHTVQAIVDYSSDSFRDNDTATVTLVNSPLITSFPYLQNFETGNGSWYTGGIKASWEYGTPVSDKIKSAASGSKAWKTRLAGNYNDLELSYLYSPCFDLTGMTNPTLSFSLALDIEDCGGSLCDGAWVEYSADGLTWTKLGAFGSGTNWYNKNYSGNQLWSIQDYTRWHVATAALPTGISRLRLRFVVATDEGVNREGIAIDDIHIYDNTHGIYNGVTLSSPITQTVSGSSWIDFIDAGTNKLVASINPNGQNMGSTDVQAYINSGAVRYTATQYYHDRNLTIIPANYNLADSATVRFYFLDSETEALINAGGCPSCSKPLSAYELGISKYTDPANRSSENGTLTDDIMNGWSFINASNVTKVPFDRGYYAEYKVKNFSEHWLNNGGTSGFSALPLKLISFSARKKTNNDVLVEWKTAQEFDVDRYEIEVAKSNSNYQQNNFVKIGETGSHGNSASEQDYNFTDLENNKSGTRYYRLKIIENDGSFSYSPIRPVVFNHEISWQVYPNPSNGIFNVEFQQAAGETMNLKVYDANGKLIRQHQLVADGFVQKFIIDLQQPDYAPGLYMIIAEGSEKKLFKVVKQ